MESVLLIAVNDGYFGETVRRISERMMDHNGRNLNSHLFKHHIVKELQCP